MNKRRFTGIVLRYLLVNGIAIILILNSSACISSIHKVFAQNDNSTYEGPIPEDNNTIDNNPEDLGSGPIPEDNTTSSDLNSGIGESPTISNPENLSDSPEQIYNGTGSEDMKIALQNSEQITQELEQESSQLTNSLQAMLSDLQAGQYYGPIMGGDPSTTDYSITFTGSAVSNSNTNTTNMSGEIFVENIKTGTDAIKYKVTGGEILIGSTPYEIAFGKARANYSTGSSLDSITLISHAIDNNGTPVTIRLLIHTASSLEGTYGSSPIQIILQTPYSAINNALSLSGSGQLSIITS